MKTVLSLLPIAFAAHRHTVLRTLLFAGLLVLGGRAAYEGSYTSTFDRAVGAGTPGGSATWVADPAPPGAGLLRFTPDARGNFGNLLALDLDPGSAIQSFTKKADS